MSIHLELLPVHSSVSAISQWEPICSMVPFAASQKPHGTCIEMASLSSVFPANVVISVICQDAARPTQTVKSNHTTCTIHRTVHVLLWENCACSENHKIIIITGSVVLWKIQKFDWLIPKTKWHSCLHNRAFCSYLATTTITPPEGK